MSPIVSPAVSLQRITEAEDRRLGEVVAGVRLADSTVSICCLLPVARSAALAAQRVALLTRTVSLAASSARATPAQRSTALAAALAYATSDVGEETAGQLARHFVSEAIEQSMPAPDEDDVRAAAFEHAAYEARLARAGRRQAIKRAAGGWR